MKKIIATALISALFIVPQYGVSITSSLAEKKCESSNSELDKVVKIFNNSDSKNAIYSLQTNDGDRMDVPYIFKLNSELYAIYHHTNAGDDGAYDRIMLAKSDTNTIKGPWTNVKALSERGSMAYVKKDPYSDGYFMAYELERHGSNGNTLAIRYYLTSQDLINNTFKNEVQLSSCVRIAAPPNTITDKCQPVQNIGTPSIEDFDEDHQHLNFRFHYSLHTDDVPGTGNVLLSRDMVGVHENYGDWQGKFSNDTNNSLRVAGAKGKIGMRDSFDYNGNKYYLYEAQLSDDPDRKSHDRWASWRIFLYSPLDNKAIMLNNLDPSGNLDIANPRIYIDGQNLYLSVFIPSEGGGVSPAGPAIFGKFLLE